MRTEEAGMEIIGRTSLNATEEVRVGMDEWKGRTVVHARRYYRSGSEWHPGKGLALPPELLPWLVDALQRTLAECIRTGATLPEDFSDYGLPAPPELVAFDAAP